MSSGVAPSVSVVLPTFNNAATLPVALASLAKQIYEGDVELVCVDGGSTDATVAIAGEYGARIVENPATNEEEGRALGLEAAAPAASGVPPAADPDARRSGRVRRRSKLRSRSKELDSVAPLP